MPPAREHFRVVPNAEVTDRHSGNPALRSGGSRTREEISAVTDRRTQIIARTGILADNDREVDGYH
jgi:hypothetical protein